MTPLHSFPLLGLWTQDPSRKHWKVQRLKTLVQKAEPFNAKSELEDISLHAHPLSIFLFSLFALKQSREGIT